ncbi:hypothetical protein MBLNU230_g5799t1 [Neophaeotheca triangularis]
MADAAKNPPSKDEVRVENKRLEVQFKAQHGLMLAFFALILVFHVLGIYLFCSGFLLSRLVLPDRSECAVPPVPLHNGFTPGDPDKGCWHPKTFSKAVVVLIDALRYDFTVPFLPQPGDDEPHYFHNALPVMHELAVQHPEQAFLLPFIADPPTTTLQRLKGLTTGSLPTLIDAGSNFAGTAIDEDNLIEQLHHAGKKVVHLGDDTWHSLFPGYFDKNLTRAYDSFNVWDLHTVDNGVSEHLLPLLEPARKDEWDVVIGHYLGVDHAGHRYGPDHVAMREKLAQMDAVVRQMVERLDDDTLLVVMGDHGMDIKGDHGGESDDEVEAALWMYSKKGAFGRSDKAFVEPPATAKERPVGQIDLVPTLALLLGLQVPFNNLGRPIEEAFVGKNGNDFENLAEVGRLTAAQIHRYQGKYAAARGLDESATSPPLWETAQEVWRRLQETGKPKAQLCKDAYTAFMDYQAENLRVCRSLWARFDLVSMGLGISVLILTFVVLVIYAQGVAGDRGSITPLLLGWAGIGSVAGGLLGMLAAFFADSQQYTAFGVAVGGNIGLLLGFWPLRNILRVPVPKTLWGWLCTATTAMLCIGFASNSFTIWEDEQLLFFLATFGVLLLGSSLGQADRTDRMVGVANSVSFLIATRLSSLSRLCREEQMPDCRSTYYASATSSTSAGWQLAIPFAVAFVLPSAMKDFYSRSKNYQGSAVVWIGAALRIGLVLVALYWTLDAADNGEWYPNISKSILMSGRVVLAQIILAVAYAAGYSTYIWSGPLLAVEQEEGGSSGTPTNQPSSLSKPINDEANAPILTTISGGPPTTRPKIIIFGYANTHGTRYFLLPAAWLLALLLVQKPMGQGTLALCTISILNILEILDANDLRRSPVGPILLALLGSYYYFKTGHQATLASIQWDTAFIALKTIHYPWSPLLVMFNTFGAQILCTIAVPAIPLWKVPPRPTGVLGRVAAALATYLLFFAAVALATVVEAGWLRRHLMLYRIFMPRMLMAVAVLVITEVVGLVVALVGVRWSILSVADVFGWTESFSQ